MDFQDILA